MSGEHKIGGGARELSDLVPAFHDREAELIRQLDGARLMSLQYLKELESEREKLAICVEALEKISYWGVDPTSTAIAAVSEKALDQIKGLKK